MVRLAGLLVLTLSLAAACATTPPLVSTYAASPAEVAEVRQALDGLYGALDRRDIDALVSFYADDARIESLAAGGKVDKARYRAAMANLTAGTDPPRFAGGEPTIAFQDAGRATVRRPATITSRAGSERYLVEYRMERRDGRWQVVEQVYR